MAILGYVSADFAIADSLPLPDPNKVGRAGVFVIIPGNPMSLWVTANASLTTFAWAQIALEGDIPAPIFDVLHNLPNPNSGALKVGQFFYATNCAFAAVLQGRPDSPSTTKWWQPINDSQIVRNDVVAGVGGVTATTFGTLAAGTLQTPGAIGEDVNAVAYSTDIAGATVRCVSVGVALVKSGATSFQFGDLLMTDATGLAISWDGNPAHHRVAMAMQSTLPGVDTLVALLQAQV